ncbi:MAG: type II toxin-antitoxin system VapC family toxin [Holophagales bacterium]|nr:type II toxin-antitoxin system VapC family toxin [Holophagales bacterium]
MRLLVDTHIMLWWLRADPRLSDQAGRLVGDGSNEVLWSVASSWEIAVKVSVGKLELERPLHRFYADLIGEQNLKPLEIRHDHLVHVASLPLHHRDPFDRLLVAQAQLEKVPILTADPKIALYEVETLA